jgi:hypothetical protein
LHGHVFSHSDNRDKKNHCCLKCQNPDLREANFTSLRLLAQLWDDPELLESLADGWQHYVKRHTNIPFLAKAKRFRQIVLGTLV